MLGRPITIVHGEHDSSYWHAQPSPPAKCPRLQERPRRDKNARTETPSGTPWTGRPNASGPKARRTGTGPSDPQQPRPRAPSDRRAEGRPASASTAPARPRPLLTPAPSPMPPLPRTRLRPRGAPEATLSPRNLRGRHLPPPWEASDPPAIDTSPFRVRSPSPLATRPRLPQARRSRSRLRQRGAQPRDAVPGGPPREEPNATPPAPPPSSTGTDAQQHSELEALVPTTTQTHALTHVAAALQHLAQRRLATPPPPGAPPAPAAGGPVPNIDQASAAAAAWAIAATEPAAYNEAANEGWVAHVTRLLVEARHHDRTGTNGMRFLQEFFVRKLSRHDNARADPRPTEPRAN